jgi:8-oxo-dGTP diphosphatase
MVDRNSNSEPLIVESTLAAPGTSFHRGVSALMLDGDQDQVLLVHRTHERDWAPDTWDVPGGHVEDEETEIAALVREVREELGIEILETSVVLSARLIGPNFEVAYFVLEAWTGEPYNAAPEEHDEIAWVPLSELESLAIADPDILPIIGAAGHSSSYSSGTDFS